MFDRPIVSPARRRRRWAVVLIPGVAFALGLALAVGAAKTRGEPLRGVYRQEAVAVVAPRSGTLLSIDAGYGAEVSPGTVLAVIDDAGVAAQVGSLTDQRNVFARDLAVAGRKAEAESASRIAVLAKDRLEARLRYADLLRTRLDLEVRRAALEQDGHGDSAIADSRVTTRPVSLDSTRDQHRFDLADLRNHEEVLKTQIALCEDRLAELDQSIADVPRQVDSVLEVDRLREDLAATEAALAQATKTHAATSVVSPAHGRLGVYRRGVGETAAAGETLVQIFDARRPFVLLTLGLEDVRRINVGQKVAVEFAGIPSRKPLSGKVVEIVSEAERDAESATTPGLLTARVRIIPAGRLWPDVPPGTTALVIPEP